MVLTQCYPKGKKKIVTFSYDDGHSNDIRLIELFDKYGAKGTFHLNGHNYIGKSKEELSSIGEIYKNHEISCHTLNHAWPAQMPSQTLIAETLRDRAILEEIASYPVTGMSYPFGSYSDAAAQTMRNCGIVYSRTVDSTRRFFLPENFLTWHPTCHHKEALTLCEAFLRRPDAMCGNPLFYIWGHSSEFKAEEQWQEMEAVLRTLAECDKIWYATNIEIYDYLNAQKMLRISVNEKMIYNPSSIDVWINVDDEAVEVPAGKTVIL